MKTIEFVKGLKETVEQLQRDGITEIQSDKLIAYLQNIIQSSSSGDVSSADMEKYKAELQLWVEQNKSIHFAQQSAELEMFKSVIIAGQSALRTAFLMNGGATVALLAFLGKLSEQHQDKIPIFASSLVIFVCGVASITIASGATYLSQWFYAGPDGWKMKTGFYFNVLTIVLTISSYGFFIWGAVRAYVAFIGFGIPQSSP